jgi:hypothetical protein
MIPALPRRIILHLVKMARQVDAAGDHAAMAKCPG